jgi:carbamoyl-phosphate synthase large subunit
MLPITVLITSIGATGAQNVVKGLKKQTKYPVRIIGCDATALNAGAQLVDKFCKLPLATESFYLDSLLNTCKNEHINLLIPIMEPELEVVSTNISSFIQFSPSVAEYKTILSCNNKLECQKIVEELEIDCPPVFYDIHTIQYPAIVKQQKGTGSVGIKILDHKDEAFNSIPEGYFIQKFIKGIEYTVDCFLSKDYKFFACVPRIRIATKGGLSTKTTTVHHQKLTEYAEKIVRSFKLKGPSNIQFIETENKEIYFIEINPRFGGAYIASIEAGLNTPLFLLNELLGDPIEYTGFKNLTMLRYWEEKYEYSLV